MGMNDAVKDNELSNKERFYGEGDEGISHAEFERMMEGYCKEQWGPKLGEEIWHDKLLDLGTVSFDSAANLETFNAHCQEVLDSIFDRNAKASEMLMKDNKFWTIEYQTTWREKQYCKLSVKVQKLCQGEALRQVVALKTEGVHTIRDHFYLRFGGTQSAQVKDRERAYSAGMPKLQGGVAFPPKSDLTKWLNLLEKERDWFTHVCPDHLVDD